MTNETTVVEYVYYRVISTTSSSGSWENRSDGGGNNGGKYERSAPREEKPPIRPLRATTKVSLTQNPKRTVDDKGRSQLEEICAVVVLPPTACQP